MENALLIHAISVLYISAIHFSKTVPQFIELARKQWLSCVQVLVISLHYRYWYLATKLERC